jgi:adenylate cyclase
MSLALIDPTGNTVAAVAPGPPVVVGRAVECEVTLTDPTISRRHAELRAEDAELEVRDLGSRNGTFRNGQRVDTARLRAGDVVTFGGLTLRVVEVAAEESPEPAPDSRVPTDPPPGMPAVRRSETSLEQELPIVAERGGATPATELAAKKLAMLLDVAKGLGGAGEVGALFDRVVGYAFDTLDADRAAILVVPGEDEPGADVPAADALVEAVARDRWGGNLMAAGPRPVPRSIARAALERRAALLSVNASEDARFGGQSVLHQRVRSAMCAPLLARDGTALGALYVDSAAPDRTFDEVDLDFLSAFAGIVAVSLETTRLGEQLRREAVTRGNFERYFAPNVAERIARSREFARPGGERRRVAVLFGDLRGFTALAAASEPDAVADTISSFLSAMVDCVFRHGGTLDKFIGDAVMAQWGAPESHVDDADRAMRAALDMIDALDALNERRAAEGSRPLRMGIGVAYGEVFAGNIGSERRLEFTVLGETVNQASRLCDAAGPNEILVSEGLRRELREPPPLRLAPLPESAGASPPVYAVVRRVG